MCARGTDTQDLDSQDRTARHGVSMDICFRRFHARRQARSDSIMLVGAVMYLFMLRQVLKTDNLAQTLLVLLLSVLAAWPAFFCSGSGHEFYLQHRDNLFAVHFLVHHCIAPRLMTQLGVDMPSLRSSSNPILFFLGLIMTRTLVWHCVNSMMYRMQLKKFLWVQPLVLLLSLPFEWDACKWAAERRPAIAAATFGHMARWGRVLTMAAGGPQLLVMLRHATGLDSGLGGCYRDCLVVNTFFMGFFGLLLPAFVIWWLERYTWRDFINADAASLMWQGGPSQQEIQEEQLKLQRAWAQAEVTPDSRIYVVALMSCTLLWLVVEVAMWPAPCVQLSQ